MGAEISKEESKPGRYQLWLLKNEARSSMRLTRILRLKHASVRAW